MATVIVGLTVAAVLVLVGRQLYKDKKKGKSLCGGKCSGCLYGSTCPNGCACNEIHKKQ